MFLEDQRTSIRGIMAAVIGTVLLGACEQGATVKEGGVDHAFFTEDLTPFIEGALADLERVPGLSVAIYSPDATYIHGFGVTDLDSGVAVTADTGFYIASTTKPMTALAIAMLEERGELSLDTTLAEYAPDMTFSAEIRPELVTLRSLLTHTSGIRHEPLSTRLAFTGEHTPDLLRALVEEAYPNENAPYGTFAYSNVGYNILTVLTEEARGQTWQDLLEVEVFTPLGMVDTTTSITEATQSGKSFAMPYFGGPGERPVRSPLEKTDATMQSAGGVVTTAADAVRFLEIMVEDGQLDGEQLIPASVIRSTRAPLAKVENAESSYPREAYGLGWYTGEQEGEELVHHFGGFPGYRSHISYMPSQKIGVAIFMNEGMVGEALPEIIANYVYDTARGERRSARTANRALRELVNRRERVFETITADRERRAARQWTMSLPKAAYAGTYANETWGTAIVEVQGEALSIRMGSLYSVAEPFEQQDTIRVEMIPYRGRLIQFQMGEEDQPASLIYEGVEFTREASN